MTSKEQSIPSELRLKIDALKTKLEESINDSILKANSLFTFSEILSISTDGKRVRIDGLAIEFNDFVDNYGVLDMYLSEKEQSV